MAALTKEQIQSRLRAGTSRVVHVDAPELDGELAVRPLTQGETDEVNEAAVKGQKYTGAVAATANGDATQGRPEAFEMDLGRSARAQATADRITVAYGLSVEEKWSHKDVAGLPPALFRRVLAKVHEISDDAAFIDDAGSFRGDPRGGDDGDAGGVGDSAGSDAG